MVGGLGHSHLMVSIFSIQGKTISWGCDRGEVGGLGKVGRL